MGCNHPMAGSRNCGNASAASPAMTHAAGRPRLSPAGRETGDVSCRRLDFLGEFAHLINGIFAALEKRESRYASVMGALLDLAGVPARPVQIEEDETPDASWNEPAAFDGCGAAGRSASGSAQPLQFVRNPGRHDASALPEIR
mgnify:CR=1 FL=1